MRAMILAAGLGKRLRPLTEYTPKPLLEVGGKPLIVHMIEKLVAAGVQQIVINTHYLAEKISTTLGDGRMWGIHIHYSHEPELLNTGGGIARALPWLGEDPFWVVSGDIVTDFPLQSLPILDTQLAHLVMVPNPNFNPQGDYQVVDGKLALAQKSDYTYGNLAVFSPQFFKRYPHSKIFPLKELLDQACREQLITAEVYHGRWFNIGTVAELRACEQLQ